MKYETDSKLLTLEEAADICRLSQQTIRRMIRDGEIPAYKLGYNSVRLEEKQLQLFIESRRTAPGK